MAVPVQPPRSVAAVLLTLVLALAAAGCGDDAVPASQSGPSTSDPGPASTADREAPPPRTSPAAAPEERAVDPAPAPPTARATPADPLPPVPPQESAAPVGQPQCRTGELTVVDADTLVLEALVHEVFVVRTAGAECQLEGYPAVRLTDAAGRPLPVTVAPGGNGLAGTPGPVTLSRGTSVSFVLSTPREGTCVDATGVEVVLPGTSTPLRTATALPVCDGSVGVSPVLRRTDEE